MTTPQHYALTPEPDDVIDAWDLNFRLGKVIELVASAGRKGSRLEDLEKAAEYLKREIEKERASAPINREEIGWHPEDWSPHIVPQSSVEDIYIWLKREGALGNIIFNDAKWVKP